MKKLNALTLCVAMSPAYILGISTALAGDQKDVSGSQEESIQSVTEEKNSGMDKSQSAAKSGKSDGNANEQTSDSTSGALYSSDLVGNSVMSRDSYEKIGSIKDIELSEDGKIVSVIVDVGGFLGIGEKEIAIPWSEVERKLDNDGESYMITVGKDAESLEKIPAHERAPTSSSTKDESK